MNLDDWHKIFVSVCIVLVLVTWVPVVTAPLSNKKDSFFALAVLGEEGMMEHYYPDDDPTIEVGEKVRWTLYLYNHMGTPQYIAIRIKLLNSTMISPNITSCSPSPHPEVYEIRYMILDNETWRYPLSWIIEDAEPIGDFFEIKQLRINDELIKTSSFSENGLHFRFIFELWVYNEVEEDFQFIWGYGEESYCAWNQVWFNATATVT